MALYRGTGGAEFEMEPPDGGNQLEVFEAKVAAGELVLVKAAPKAKSAAASGAKSED